MIYKMAASMDSEIAEILPNFRPFYPRKCSNSDPKKIKAVLFRTSRPDFLNEEQADMIYQSGIKTIVNLRPAKEYLKTNADKNLDKYYTIYYPPEPIPKVKTIYKANEPVKLVSCQSRNHKVQKTDRRHICLDFFKMNYVLHVLYLSPVSLILKSIFYLLKDLLSFGSKYYNHFVGYFAEHFLNRDGLGTQYSNMIDWSKASICAALKVLAEPGSLPAMINCLHGKDRTGILVALILSLMDVPREEILDDYALSQEGLAPIRERVHFEICVRYRMSPEFKEAKRETMNQMLEYVDKKYGSVVDYMDHIGFGKEERQRLRDNLIRAAATI